MSLFTSSEVLKEVNITYRQLSYWQLKGIVKPTFQKLGSRDFKRYTQQDIDTLKTVKKLLDEGYSLPATETLKEIAKRKEVEEALRESREKYRALAESSVDAIFIHNREGRYLYANKACTKLFGRKPDEIVGKKLTSFFTQEKAKEVLEGIRHAFYKNKVVHIEYSLSLQEVVRYFFATIAPIHSVQGDVVLVMRVVRDITEHKKVETALRTSEQKFKDLTETTTDWVWEVNRDGVYTYASPKIKDLLGYKVSEVVGKTPFDLMPAEEAEKIGKFFKEKVIKKEPFYRLENINRHKDGHLAVLETSGIPLFGEKGQLKGYRGIDRDITERKKAEEESKNLAKFPSENPNPVLRIAKDGKVLHANNAGFELLAKWESKVGGAIPERWCRLIARAFKSKQQQQQEEEEEEEVNDRSFSFVIAPVIEVGYANLYGRDITERKKAEEKIKLFSQAIEGAIDAVAITDKEGIITYVNPTMERLYGYDKGELIGKFVNALHPDPKIAKQILSSLLKTSSWNGETLQQKKNKEIFSVILSLSTVRDEKGNPIATMGAVRDITERKKAEKALRESEANYRELADSITDVFFAMDKDLRYTYWNRASEKLTGIKAKDAIGKSIFEIFPDREDTRRAIAVYREVLKTQQPQNFVNEYQLKGKHFFFEISAYPSKVGLSVFVKDVTGRKRAEEIEN